jgi:transaldolase
MVNLNALKISFFSDGADITEITQMKKDPLVRGFTTNPTLMKAAGVKDYFDFARRAADIVFPLPISFEVFEDDFHGMARQARAISNLKENVFVKIPITNTQGLPSYKIIKELNAEGIKLNITAVFTKAQAMNVIENLTQEVDSVVSVFAGRIADSGRDPIPTMKDIRTHIGHNEYIKLLWASPREVLNVIQAEQSGCDIITMSKDLWKKLPNLGKDLDEFSIETVRMFYEDAKICGFSI